MLQTLLSVLRPGVPGGESTTRAVRRMWSLAVSAAALAIAPRAFADTKPLFGSFVDTAHTHSWAGYQGEWVDQDNAHHSLFRIDGVWRRGEARYDRFYGAHWLPGFGGVGLGRQRPMAPILLFGQGMMLRGAQFSVERDSWWGGGLIGHLQESRFTAGAARFDDPIGGFAGGGRLFDLIDLGGSWSTWKDDSSGQRMRSTVVSVRTPTWKAMDFDAAYGTLLGGGTGTWRQRQALRVHATLQGPQYLLAIGHQQRGARYARPEDIGTSTGFEQFDSSGRLRFLDSWEWSHQSRTTRSSSLQGRTAWQSFAREEVQWHGDRMAEIASLQYHRGEVSQARLGLRTQFRDAQNHERAETGLYLRLRNDGQLRWDELMGSLSGYGRTTDWQTRFRVRHPVYSGQHWPTLSTSLHLNVQTATHTSSLTSDLLLDYVPDREARQRSNLSLRLRGRAIPGPRTEISAAASGRASWDGSRSMTFNGTGTLLANANNRVELTSSLVFSRFPEHAWQRNTRFGLLWNQAFGGPRNRIWRDQLLPSLQVRVVARPKTGGPQEGVGGVAVTLNGTSTAFTDSQGWARFDRLDPGSVDVVVDTVSLGPNYKPLTTAHRRLHLRAATTRVLPIELETSSSILVVAWNDLDESGVLPFGYIPIPAIPLLVDGQSGFATDSSGVLFLPDQEPGPHEVALDTTHLDAIFHPTKGSRSACTLRSGNEVVVDFGLRAYGRLQGQVVLQPNAGEDPLPAPGPVDIYANGRWLTATDISGHFSCEAPVGALEIEAKLRQLPQAPIAVASHPQRTEIKPHTPTRTTIELPRHCRLRVQIKSADADFDPMGLPLEIVGGSFQYTSATGEVLFEPLEPATVTVRLLPDYVPEGYKLASPASISVELHRGEETSVQFRIEPEAAQ